MLRHLEQKDYRELPRDVRRGLQWHLVDRAEEVFDLALLPAEKDAESKAESKSADRSSVESAPEARRRKRARRKPEPSQTLEEA